MAISKDGTLIVKGDNDGTVRRWDASTRKSIGETMYGHSGWVNAIVISDDGRLIVTGSYDGNVRQWKARNGEAIGKSMEDSSPVTELVISTDGSVIASLHRDNRIVRWKAKTGEKIGEPIIAGWPESLVISYDGKIIACVSALNDFVEQ